MLEECLKGREREASACFDGDCGSEMRLQHASSCVVVGGVGVGCGCGCGCGCGEIAGDETKMKRMMMLLPLLLQLQRRLRPRRKKMELMTSDDHGGEPKRMMMMRRRKTRMNGEGGWARGETRAGDDGRGGEPMAQCMSLKTFQTWSSLCILETEGG